jgi:hypothetical protein
MVKAVKKRGSGELALLLGTIKGGFVLGGNAGRRRWEMTPPHFLGSRVHDFRLDPRDGRTLLLCSTGGHLGPTIYRSSNGGRRWTEAKRPPQFAKLPKGKRPGRATASKGQAVKLNLWLTPGHESEPGAWYCGTSPQGIFRSTDGGDTWRGVAGFNDGLDYRNWTGGGKNETPDGAFLHSICVDPRDKRHMLLSLSIGGTFETRDQGRKWTPLNQGVAADFQPKKDPEYGHDPHCVIMHPADPDRLYQQNHCGSYRLDRAPDGRRGRSERWERIGNNMPKKIGDIGFPVVGHPTDRDTVWVFPMDGTAVWPRTSPGGKPAVYRTRDAGKSWERQDRGLPAKNAWFTVLRQALDADDRPRNTGLYFGTTSGEVWASRNGGESWERIAEHLPRILSLRVAGMK